MATASPYNRGYTGGIAARGAMPVGRGAYDLNRAAEQTFRRTGSPAPLMAMDWRNQMAQRRMPMMPPQGAMMPEAGMSARAPVAPAPQGTWTPGFNGSQIFVPASAPTVPQPPQAMPAMPQPMGGMMNGEGRMTNAALPAPPPMAFPFPALPATGGALPPSTLGGQPGTPPPPAFFNQQVGGWDVLGANTAQGPKFMNARPVEAPAPPPLSMPELGRLTAAGFEPFQVNGQSFDANGVPYIRKIPQPTEKVTEFDGTQRRTFERPMSANPPPKAATPATSPATPAGSPATFQPFKTKSGYEINPQPQAGVQTGQMPAANYANDLTPEQSLAAAREHYLATGDGSKIDEHFRQFPSQRSRELSAPTWTPQMAAAPRVMTQQEALTALQPPTAPQPTGPRPQPPQLLPYLAAIPGQVTDYARRNPLVTIRQ